VSNKFTSTEGRRETRQDSDSAFVEKYGSAAISVLRPESSSTVKWVVCGCLANHACQQHLDY
jgi:hypothetical protein